jgi:hypothetical protein
MFLALGDKAVKDKTRTITIFFCNRSHAPVVVEWPGLLLFYIVMRGLDPRICRWRREMAGSAPPAMTILFEWR